MKRLMLLTMVFSFICCKSEEVNINTNKIETGIIVTIYQSAGALYNDHAYLPLLGNLAYTDRESQIEILVLGKPGNVGSSYGVDPIGLIKYFVGSEEKQLIVAIPTNPEFQSIKISDLVDLSVNHGSIKRIIEQWYSSFSGLGGNRIIRWENKSAAFNVLK